MLVAKFSDGLAGWYIIATFKFLHVGTLRILPLQTSVILKHTVGYNNNS